MVMGLGIWNIRRWDCGAFLEERRMRRGVAEPVDPAKFKRDLFSVEVPVVQERRKFVPEGNITMPMGSLLTPEEAQKALRELNK
jgi:hypothetical protein